MGHVRFRLHTRVMLAVTGLALVLAAGGCKRLFEVANCQSAAEKACDKWFDCWPGVSALAWGTTAGCKTSLRDWCTETDGCELDDEALLHCEQNVAGSACGAMPASCNDLKACWEQTN
jgi:hypothetical protein